MNGISRRDQINRAISAVQREDMTGQPVESPSYINANRWEAMKAIIRNHGIEALLSDNS